MRASELLDLKTQQLMSTNPAMDYEQALRHTLRFDPNLAAAYAGNMEVQPTESELHFAETLNPTGPAFVREVVARARQAKADGTVDKLDGALGRLIRRAWMVASSQGLEIGATLEELIRRGDGDAPLAAAELAVGTQIPGGKFSQQEAQRASAQAATFSAGIRVTERITALQESRRADGMAELNYHEAMKQVLQDDPELARAYTGAEA